MSVKGKVYLNEQNEYEWEIKDFLSFNNMKSPTFFFRDIGLFMEVSVFKKEDSIQVAIYNTNFLSEKSSRPLYIYLIMKAADSHYNETRNGILDASGKLRFYRWIPWTEMLRNRRQILSNGCLKISSGVYEISEVNLREYQRLAPTKPEKVTEDEINETERSQDFIPLGNAKLKDANKDSNEEFEDETHIHTKSVKSLLKALRSMLKNGEDNDVVINVQGKEFRAHKGILRARSSVFQSMFDHNMLEKQSGVVKIDDCDPEIFSDFLDHIYTGSTGVISAKNVFSLYETSDKYDIESLKEECVEYMKNNLTVDSFCHAITLAVKHDEIELVNLATEFFCGNSLDIIRTAKWQIFLQENATIGNELFVKMLLK